MQMQSKSSAPTVAPPHDTVRVPEQRRFSRRRLLTQAVALSAAAAGLGLVASCGRTNDVNEVDDDPSNAATLDGANAACDDAAELSEQDRARREVVHYVDVSTQRDKTCDQCRFFKPLQTDDDPCGACDILAGAVAASGYCNAFVQRG